MPRKKKEEAPSGGNAPWMNTFADLMNLLLCFFVLLFAMSDVDSEKFQQISISLSNSFGIFEGGGSALDYSDLVSSGMTQLNDLDEYFNNMGVNNQKNENSTEGEHNTDTKNNTQTESGDIVDINDAINTIASKMAEVSENMYDDLSELTDQYNLGKYVELAIDSDYQFVQISLKGSILFDSGDATIKEDAKPILSKIGDILKKFEGYTVEIEGHTDNDVPRNTSTYKNNNWLSSARALNAAEYLINTKKLNPEKIKYSGRGEYDPIESNQTPEGKAKNRRIEIKIYNEYSGR